MSDTAYIDSRRLTVNKDVPVILESSSRERLIGSIAPRVVLTRQVDQQPCQPLRHSPGGDVAKTLFEHPKADQQDAGEVKTR